MNCIQTEYETEITFKGKHRSKNIGIYHNALASALILQNNNI